MPIKVKICGISTKDTLEAVIKGGADFVGFVFFEKSPRYVSIKQAVELCKLVPEHISRVGLFVNPTDEFLEETLSAVSLDILQLHGNETVSRVKEIKQKTGLPIIKAVGISSLNDLNSALDYKNAADWLLFDAKPPKNSKNPGGNAVSFDWKLLKNNSITSDWILAGGLDVNNLEQAVYESKASIVDISSGVEDSSGVKSTEKIIIFLKKAKQL